MPPSPPSTPPPFRAVATDPDPRPIDVDQYENRRTHTIDLTQSDMGSPVYARGEKEPVVDVDGGDEGPLSFQDGAESEEEGGELMGEVEGGGEDEEVEEVDVDVDVEVEDDDNEHGGNEDSDIEFLVTEDDEQEGDEQGGSGEEVEYRDKSESGEEGEGRDKSQTGDEAEDKNKSENVDEAEDKDMSENVVEAEDKNKSENVDEAEDKNKSENVDEAEDKNKSENVDEVEDRDISEGVDESEVQDLDDNMEDADEQEKIEGTEEEEDRDDEEKVDDPEEDDDEHVIDIDKVAEADTVQKEPLDDDMEALRTTGGAEMDKEEVVSDGKEEVQQGGEDASETRDVERVLGVDTVQMEPLDEGSQPVETAGGEKKGEGDVISERKEEVQRDTGGDECQMIEKTHETKKPSRTDVEAEPEEDAVIDTPMEGQQRGGDGAPQPAEIVTMSGEELDETPEVKTDTAVDVESEALASVEPAVHEQSETEDTVDEVIIEQKLEDATEGKAKNAVDVEENLEVGTDDVAMEESEDAEMGQKDDSVVDGKEEVAITNDEIVLDVEKELTVKAREGTSSEVKADAEMEQKQEIPAIMEKKVKEAKMTSSSVSVAEENRKTVTAVVTTPDKTTTDVIEPVTSEAADKVTDATVPTLKATLVSDAKSDGDGDVEMAKQESGLGKRLDDPKGISHSEPSVLEKIEKEVSATKDAALITETETVPRSKGNVKPLGVVVSALAAAAVTSRGIGENDAVKMGSATGNVTGNMETPSDEAAVISAQNSSKATSPVGSAVEKGNTSDVEIQPPITDSFPVVSDAAVTQAPSPPSGTESVVKLKPPVFGINSASEPTVSVPPGNAGGISAKQADDPFNSKSGQGAGAAASANPPTSGTQPTKNVFDAFRGPVLGIVVLPGTTATIPSNSTPRETSGANLTTPMFGIQASSRTGTVSFSSPPTFHKPALNPVAKPFVPSSSLLPKSPFGQIPVATEEGKASELSIPPATASSNPAESVLKASADAMDIEIPSSTQLQTLEKSNAEEVKESAAIAAPQTGSRVTQARPVGQDTGKRVKYEQKLQRIPAKGTSGGMTYSVENVSVVVKHGHGRLSRRSNLSTIELMTIPNSESKMTFSDSRSSPRNVWLSLSSTKDAVKIKKVTNKPNTMSITVLGPLKQETGNDSTKYFIHLTRNTFQVFYDACLKFILDFVPDKERSTVVKFQEPPVPDKERSTVVKFQEPPPHDRRPSSASAPVGTEKSKQDTSGKGVKPGTDNTKQLLLLKIAALERKRKERTTDSSPKRAVTFGVGGKSKVRTKKNIPERNLVKKLQGTPHPKGTSALAAPSIPSQIPSSSAASRGVALVPTPPTVIGETPDSTTKPSDETAIAGKGNSSFLNSSKDFKTPPTMEPKGHSQDVRGTSMAIQVPTSPKKRAAFRNDNYSEQSSKRARLNLPKKRHRAGDKDSRRMSNIAQTKLPPPVVQAKGSVPKPGMSGATGVVAAIRMSDPSTRNLKNDNSVQDGQRSEGGQRPSLKGFESARAGSVIVTVSDAEKKRLETDAKRLEDMLSVIERLTKDEELGCAKATVCLERCDPTSVQDFFERLYTFQPSTWRGYGKDDVLNPVECARRGWFNSGVWCLKSSEGAEIVARFEKCGTLKDVVEEENRIRKLVLGEGHKLLSGWIGKSCPEEFDSLEGSKKGYSSRELKSNASILESSKAVSYLNKSKVDWQKHEGFVGDGVGESLKLAVFNWNAKVIDEEQTDVYCAWCNRCIVLADECLIGEDLVKDVVFDLRESHYEFCPFRKTDEAVRRNVACLGTFVGEVEKGGEGKDVEMVDV